MASFVVMEPPGGRAGDAVLVRDGFHVFAFLVPALWLLVHRLWIEALLAVAVAILLGVLGAYAGLGPASSLLSLLVGIYFGMEGAALKIAALRRRGWREWGVVEAESRSDAEIRYLAGDDENGVEELPAPVLSAPRPYRAEPALGMLGYPGRS